MIKFAMKNEFSLSPKRNNNLRIFKKLPPNLKDKPPRKIS